MSKQQRPYGRWTMLCVLLAACGESTLQEALLEPDLQLAGAHGNSGGEIWVTAQDRSELKILHGFGRIETVALAAGTGPHEINFSPSGKYAYVANVGNGTVIVVRVNDRTVVATLPLGGGGAGDVGTHQAKPSPDGSIVLVSQIPSKTLIKLSADERSEQWNVIASLVLPESPLCTAFRPDGQRAYVALGPSGIAVIDVASLTLLDILPTDGSVQCGVVESSKNPWIFVDSNGGGGHFYVLNTITDEITDLNFNIGAADLHGFGVSPNEKYAYVAGRGSDDLNILDLTQPGSTATTVPLDPRPEADRPDKVAVRGNFVYVTLRASGHVARVNGQTGEVTLIEVVPASANALHGIALRN